MTASRPAEARPAFQIEFIDPVEGLAEVRVEGALTFADGGALWDRLRSKLPMAAKAGVRFDLSGLESIDGGAMALLVQAKWDLETSGTYCEFTGSTGAVAKLLALYDGDARAAPRTPRLHVGVLGHVGDSTLAAVRGTQVFLAFVGSMVLASGGVLRRPRTGNWRGLVPLVTRTGADAVPIVGLILFLIGFVMGFQSAVQLKEFGASIYVADLVALSMTRELGPLMTAIIVCGRSGAAFAAELGAMRVSEEIDALRTMGIGPLRFLVFPRVLALFLVLPVLTLLGDFVGILGGLLVGVVSLQLTITGYLNETLRALDLWDISQGLLKASVFGLAIGLISCSQGLAATGGAEGVGRRTTSSVVISLFALIVIDAAFTLGFYELGL
ncbi:MAG: MlaE family lipid ABC transporter permease subunit [Polyangiaceae bacterium]|nr:MlaE family lipid ABC transporter permease subunit [Polyangiaceae bacterium]